MKSKTFDDSLNHEKLTACNEHIKFIIKAKQQLRKKKLYLSRA